MNNIVKFILSFTTGIVCFLLVMYFMRPEKESPQTMVTVADEPVETMPQEETPVQDVSDAVLTTDSICFPKFIVEPSARLIVTMKDYHYTISAEAIIPDSSFGVHYELRDAVGNVLSDSDKCVFANIAPGSYVIVAFNESNPQASVQAPVECIQRAPIEKITPEELSAIYNSGDYGSNKAVLKSKIVSHPRITYEGMDTSNEPNEMPDTHQQLCQKIRMGTWGTITVTGIAYNYLGVATALNVNYTKSE